MQFITNFNLTLQNQYSCYRLSGIDDCEYETQIIISYIPSPGVTAVVKWTCSISATLIYDCANKTHRRTVLVCTDLNGANSLRSFAILRLVR